MGNRFSIWCSNSGDITKRVFKFINRYFYHKKGKVVILFLVIIIGILINGITPYLYGNIIDNIVSGKIFEVKRILIMFFLLSLSVNILQEFEKIIGTKVSVKISNEIKCNLFDVILWMKSKNQDNYTTGEFINRLEGDADTIVEYCIDFITSCLMIMVNMTISIVFLLRISTKLTFISCLLLPFSYIINFIFRNKVQLYRKIQKGVEDNNYKFITIAINNLKNSKILQIENRLKKEYEGIKEKSFIIIKKNIYLSFFISLIQKILNQSFEIIIIFISALLIISGNMTIGNMVSFNSYLEKLFSSISKILSINLNKHSVKISLDRIVELEKLDSEEKTFSEDRMSIKRIEFKNVSFGYSSKNIITDLNFLIDAPGLYSFVGENGAGKTSILKIISALYKKNNGEIVINGKDINNFDVTFLRNSLSYMMKETLILPTNLLDNLMLGINRQVNMNEIDYFCQKAQLLDLIKKIGGYSGMVTSETLSSGEKQKIGIIRVLLNKTDLILLDEVTSDLDGYSEQCVISILEELAKKSIIINVCHRKELVLASKQIFVLSNGKISETGVHNSLIKQKGMYNKLFK